MKIVREYRRFSKSDLMINLDDLDRVAKTEGPYYYDGLLRVYDKNGTYIADAYEPDRGTGEE